MLAELRCALLRTLTAAADLKAIGIALNNDLISTQQAADAARNVNALHLGAPVAYIDEGAWDIEPEGLTQ